MGRKTFESIGKPLPGRRNIIISRDKNLCIAGCDVFHSVDDALAAVQTAPEVMIIGGATLYAQLLPRAERIYLTRIEAVFDGDTFFPVLSAQWQLLSAETHRPDEKNKYHYCFEVWTNHSFFV
jgi:dihydrofolate reductase